MLTFEEFFTKKKIDLAALKKADAFLFVEFEEHYALMGEKSFDHSKKFWFNRLRHVHPLQEVPDVSSLKEKAKEDTLEQNQASNDTVKIAKPTGFKPRFKATETALSSAEDNTPKVEGKAEELKTEITESAIKPTGFKPRFKPGVTKTTSTEENSPNIEAKNNNNNAETSEPVSKPAGFKPRFKAGVTKTTSTEESSPKNEAKNDNINTETSEPVSKPAGFKPRFKAGVTKNINDNKS